MWSSELNQGRTLLRVSFSGHVSTRDAKACTERVQVLVGEVPAGFTLLTDLTGLEEMELGCEPFIDQMMDFLNRKGVRKVVRVVPRPEKDIGLGIMSLFHYDRQVRVVTCKTASEAEAHLPR